MSIQFRNKEDAEINKSYKPSKELQQTRERVYKRYADMSIGRQHPWGKGNMENYWNGWNKQYESWRQSKDPSDWQATIVPPFTTTVVEKAIAEIVRQAVMPRALPREDGDQVAPRIMDYSIDYTWDIGDGELELFDAVKQGLVLGNTIWQEFYWQDKREVNILKSFDLKKGKEEYTKKTIYDFNDVYGETVPLQDIYIDPSAETINRGTKQANDVIRRYIMDYDSFMENFQGTIYDPYGASEYVKPGASQDYFQFFTPIVGMEDKVVVYYYWSKRPDKLVIVANDVVLRDGPNPFRHKKLPFCEWKDVARVKGNGYWAMGESELLSSIQDELTTIRRMRIDRQHLDIYKTFLTGDRFLMDDDEATVAPSRFIPVGDPEAIKVLEYKDINPSAYQEEAIMKEEGRAVSGIESPQPASTATEAAILRESTMRSLEIKIWRISRELLKGIAELRSDNILQYWTEDKAKQVLGPNSSDKWRTIVTENVELGITPNKDRLVEREKKGRHVFKIESSILVPERGSFRFKFTGEPKLPISRTLRQQKLTEFSNTPIVQAAIQTGYWDVRKIADRLAVEFDLDPDKLRSEQQNMGETPEGVTPEMESKLIELAGVENERLTNGERIAPTPYAPMAHTQLHLAYFKSDKFKEAVSQMEQEQKETVIENMMYHIQGETAAQEMRGGEEMGDMGQMPQANEKTSMAAGIERGQAKSISPDLIMGPEMTPPGQSK